MACVLSCKSHWQPGLPPFLGRNLPPAMSSLLKLIKEDYRRRQLNAAELRLEDILKDIEENPVKFSVASSLTDDRQWIHFVAQQGAPVALRRLIECGSDIHARDAVSAVPALAVAVQPVRVIGLPNCTAGGTNPSAPRCLQPHGRRC